MIQLFDKFKNMKKRMMTILFRYMYFFLIIIAILNYVLICRELVTKILNI